MIHYTYKGRAIDMASLLMMNEHAVALGNANMNARGDILGQGGTVIKTHESLVEEYHQRQVANVINTDEDSAEVFDYQFTEGTVSIDHTLLTGFDDSEVIKPIETKTRKKAPEKE